MFKKSTGIIFILLLIITNAYGKEKLKVVTSIVPLAFFVENIGGDRVVVSTLIPPGGNPHTYEPAPGQMNELSRADLFVKAGSGVEFELIWMKRIEALNKKMPVCDASRGITLIDTRDVEGHDRSHHGGKDPHMWLSPVNAVIIADNIRNCLSKTDPVDSDYYSENTSSLIAELKTLEKRIRLELGDISNRRFFIFHPAWGYFAGEFDLEQIPVEFSGKAPTPGRLGRFIKKALKENINVIFTSPQISRKSADVIAREIKGKIVFIDPMSKDYINNLEHTARLLRENLK